MIQCLLSILNLNFQLPVENVILGNLIVCTFKFYLHIGPEIFACSTQVLKRIRNFNYFMIYEQCSTGEYVLKFYTFIYVYISLLKSNISNIYNISNYYYIQFHTAVTSSRLSIAAAFKICRLTLQLRYANYIS